MAAALEAMELEAARCATPPPVEPAQTPAQQEPALSPVFADPTKRAVKFVCEECKAENSVFITPEQLGLQAIDALDTSVRVNDEILRMLSERRRKQGARRALESRAAADVKLLARNALGLLRLPPSTSESSNSSTTYLDSRCEEWADSAFEGESSVSKAGRGAPLSSWEYVVTLVSDQFDKDSSCRSLVSPSDTASEVRRLLPLVAPS